MKKYEFSFSADWVFDEPVSRHHFLLRCMPGTYPFQRTYAHKLTLTPFAAVNTFTDNYGNTLYSGTVDKAHSSFGFSATGFVLCSKYIIHEPMDRIFLYPSPFTQPDLAMKMLLSEIDLPEGDRPKAERLCTFVHELMTYNPGVTAVDTTAAEALSARQGVSRDFVHIYLAMCRLEKIPARYVIGLCKGISRCHVWAEVYLGGAWYPMDPTTGAPVEDGYLKIAHGTDYADCAVDRYCFTSEHENIGQAKSVSVKVADHVITTRDTVPHA